jgi:predicted dehydrogenase
MFTIVGSGFGLYGYLPAILRSYSNSVILPDEYKEKILKRVELTPYLDRIIWRASIDECLRESSSVVIASTPLKQPEISCQVLNYSNIKQIVLEKPLAADPLRATNLMYQLIKSHAKFRINYSFPHCAWARNLNSVVIQDKGKPLVLTWTFCAHHFANDLQTWKRRHLDGGGVLRFYGIHLIALLTKLGYTDVHMSHLKGRRSLEPEQWQATFSLNDSPDFKIDLHSSIEENRFSVAQICKDNMNTLFSLATPFDLENESGNQDVRIGILCTLLDSLSMADAEFYKWYEATNALWTKVEAAMPAMQ